MASIYQINAQINDVFNRYEYTGVSSVSGEVMVDTETGEIVSEADVLKILNDLGVAKEEKLDAYAFKILDDTLIIDGIAAQIKKLQEYKKSVEKRKERLINTLAFEHNGKSYKDKLGRYSVTFRKSKAVNILDESVIPEVFLVPQPPKISKTEIKKAIESGLEVPGAEIKQNVSCSVK